MRLDQLAFYLLKHFSYLGVSIAVALESIGIPIPIGSFLFFIGYRSSKGQMNFIISQLFSTVGICTGLFFAYFFGCRYGEGWLDKYGKYLMLERSNVEKVGKWLKNREIIVYLLGRAVPGVRGLIPYIAGIYKLDFKRFAIFNFIGAGIWSSVYLALGLLFGKESHRFQRFLRSSHSGMIEITAVVIMGTALYILYKRKKGQIDTK